LTLYCGLEVQKPTQALKSVKGPANTFDFNPKWSRTLLISHEKYIKDDKVLDHLGLKLKVFPGSLTDLSAWVGFCTIPLTSTPSGQELCRP
jgi:hypothetical protein